MFKRLLYALALSGAAIGAAQQTQTIDIHDNGGRFGRLTRPYRSPSVPPVSFQDSNRIENLLRGGNLYLSLQDAIALALENNLDVELQRYGPRFANTDLQRSEGGGTLRGIPLTATELPPGLGGPGSPLLTNSASGFSTSATVPANLSDITSLSGAQTNLAIGDATGFSAGTPVPQFDPLLTGLGNWGRQVTPQASNFVTGTTSLQTRNTVGDVGFVQAFSPGTQINASLNNSNQSTNSVRSTYNPFTNSTLGLNVTQPLLRGFGAAVNRRFIKIAKNNETITDLVFRQQVIGTVAGVIRLYYDLASLNEDVQVKQQTLSVAQKLYQDNKAQVEAGTLAPLEVVRAQAQIAVSQLDLLNSQAFAREQELVLKNVLSRRGTADSTVRAAHIVTTDLVPEPAKEPVSPVQDLIDSAFRNRPELAAARLQIENSQISLKGSRNNALPDLNLTGTMQNNGLAGQFNSLSVNPATAPGLLPGTTPAGLSIGGLGSVLSQVFQRSYPTYTIGLQLNLPLRNRVAQADVVRDELTLRQTEIRNQQLLNQARLEVEDALIALDRARAVYDAAVQARLLQEQSLDAEQQKYAVGLSTTFLIIQYQTYVAQAKSSEVVAKSDYVKAKTALQRATGQILQDYNVSVDEAYRGRMSVAPSPLPAP